MKTMESAQVTGRAWIYDDEPSEIEVFEYAFVPMELGRSGEEWCRQYLVESRSSGLRKVFGLPESGNFQVIFKGKMIGYKVNGFDYGEEYDEEFELEESHHEPIPQAYMEKP